MFNLRLNTSSALISILASYLMFSTLNAEQILLKRTAFRFSSDRTGNHSFVTQKKKNFTEENQIVFKNIAKDQNISASTDRRGAVVMIVGGGLVGFLGL